METLVVVAHHRNQCYGRVKAHSAARFGSSPSKNFREINCRTFQSAVGILPNPFKYGNSSGNKRAYSSSSTSSSSSSSPKTPSPIDSYHSIDSANSKAFAKSTPIPIKSRTLRNGKSFNELSSENFPYSELWAGPAYSNSPPPSSLPIPKFSLREKRSVSLDLPASDPVVNVHPIARSAPASPTREHNTSAAELFCGVDSATRTLRRILNLDSTDD